MKHVHGPAVFRSFCLSSLLMSVFIVNSVAQTVLPLYPGGIPNSRTSADEEKSDSADGILIISKISRPTLTVYLPPKEKATGVAVIICPGGGYSIVAAGHEGADVAKRFNEAGITAFVLKYRIPSDQTMINKEIGPLQDAQRAIQIVRSRAAEWGVDPRRTGMMGFSAGGHLASTAGTHFNKSYIDNPRVTDQTPPAFLVHAKDDPAVPYANSEAFASALRKHHIPVKVFLFEKGGHGFGLVNKTSDIRWMDECLAWMKSMGD